MKIKQSKNIDKRWVWIGLGAFFIFLRIVLAWFPNLVEITYSRGIFQIVRYISDYTVSLLPVPLIYLLIFGLICWLYLSVKKSKFRTRTYLQNVLNFGFSLIAFMGGLVFFFLLLWGFNYARIPIEKQLGLEVINLSDDALKASFLEATIALNQVYLSNKNNPPSSTDLENEVRKHIKNTFKAFNYPTPGRVRARQLKPNGVLLRIGTAGVYLPFVGECHVDGGLHALQVPFVMAHEMAHGYGITDEGSCNFIALRSCIDSGNPFFQYSAYLSYWKTLAYSYRSYFPEEYEIIKAKLDPGILGDISAIRARMDEFPDIFPEFRNLAYNTYLKTQGISEGIKNYSRVILLEAAFQKKIRGE